MKSWSKASGSASWSKSGSTASKLLNTPLPLKTHGRGESPEKTIGEKRSAALGLHNMEKTKAKHDAAAAADRIPDEQAHDSAPDGRRSSQVRIFRTPYDHTLTGVEEEDYVHDQPDGNVRGKPRRIRHFSSDQQSPCRTDSGMFRVPVLHFTCIFFLVPWGLFAVPTHDKTMRDADAAKFRRLCLLWGRGRGLRHGEDCEDR
jgi:hypothetical protein